MSRTSANRPKGLLNFQQFRERVAKAGHHITGKELSNLLKANRLRTRLFPGRGNHYYFDPKSDAHNLNVIAEHNAVRKKNPKKSFRGEPFISFHSIGSASRPVILIRIATLERQGIRIVPLSEVGVIFGIKNVKVDRLIESGQLRANKKKQVLLHDIRFLVTTLK